MSDSANEPESVSIDIRGRQLSLEGVSPEELGGFHTLVPTTHRHRTGEIVVSQTLESLCESERGFSVPNAGLAEPAAYRALELDCEVAELPNFSSRGRTPIISRDSIENISAVEFVASHRQGIVRYDGEATAIGLCVDIAKSLLGSRIVFVSRHRERRESLSRRLGGIQIRAVLATNVDVVDQGAALLPQRIVIGAYSHLMYSGYQTADLVVFMDAMECQRDDAKLFLEPADACYNLIGLVDARSRIAVSMRDRLSSVFGLRVVNVPSNGLVRRPTVLARVRISTRAVEIGRDDRQTEQLEKLIWQNRSRNGKICELTMQISAGHTFVESRKQLLRDWMQTNPGCKRVLVVTQNEKHAVRLARQLLDAPLQITEADDLAILDRMGISPDEQTNLAPRMQVDPTPSDEVVIASQGTLNTIRLCDFDVLVWAGGGKHAPSLSPWWNAAAHGADRPMLLVDFRDDFNPTARSWSVSRRNGFRAGEVYPVGTDQNVGRVEDFSRRQERYRRAAR